MNQKSKKFKDLFDVVVAILVAVAIYYGLGLVLRTSMPVVTVVSDSMLPIFHVGDLLIVENIGTPNVGDVVVYKVSITNYPIVHRIVGRKFVNGTYYYVMKGDNNNADDPWLVQRSNIIGKVFFVFPMFGYPRYLMYLPFKTYDESHFFKPGQ